jgi:hypothetical protein
MNHDFLVALLSHCFAQTKMTTYQILYWHDIPLQVRANAGRNRASKMLPERFQQAVDNAAMQAGLTGDDAYLELLRWSDPEERDGSPEEVAAAVAAEIEAEYATIDWRNTAESIQTFKRSSV